MEIVEATADQTRPLRLAVLRPGLPPDTPTLEDPPGAVHLAARDGGEVVGAAVLVVRPFARQPGRRGWQLRGMAVAPARQGTGVGAQVLAAAVRLAAGRGVEVLWCQARTSAVGFYERQGWRVEGEEFTGAMGLPHVLMWRAVEPLPDATSS
ncbi:GNAT family N-acetyltransferase [Jatrophihabitans fulvus]